ncbi:hypothetical protein [Mesorhizobium shangrilense]|uniref:Uncharacterized protein n=1 Tax=Mesorhizobium shangrilense TaxID=460060 RepID=A0ABV2DM36_9HYPH
MPAPASSISQICCSVAAAEVPEFYGFERSRHRIGADHFKRIAAGDAPTAQTALAVSRTAAFFGLKEYSLTLSL